MHRVAALAALTRTHSGTCENLQLIGSLTGTTRRGIPELSRAKLLAATNNRRVIRLGPGNVRRVNAVEKPPERLLTGVKHSKRLCLGMCLGRRQRSVAKKDTDSGNFSFDLGVRRPADPRAITGDIQPFRPGIHPLVTLKPESGLTDIPRELRAHGHCKLMAWYEPLMNEEGFHLQLTATAARVLKSHGFQPSRSFCADPHDVTDVSNAAELREPGNPFEHLTRLLHRAAKATE